jgi:ferredoxin
VWWDEETGKWTGKDVPDFPIDRAPAPDRMPPTAVPRTSTATIPFIMQADGKGWLFAPSGMIDGPIPTHYEPQESTVANPLYSQQNSPTRMVMRREDNLSAPGAGVPGSEVFPYVFTTYRLTEHHTAGGMSRWLPYLSELQPEMFCEISPELAAEVGLEPYGWATLVSPRAAIEARVLVTKRMTPLTIGGKTVHQIGLPYHWGVGGQGAVVEGDSANDLLGVTMDPNVYIQNSKYVAGTIMPGRRPRGPELVDFVEKYQREAGLSPESGNQQVTVSAEDVEASHDAGRAAAQVGTLTEAAIRPSASPRQDPGRGSAGNAPIGTVRPPRRRSTVPMIAAVGSPSNPPRRTNPPNHPRRRWRTAPTTGTPATGTPTTDGTPTAVRSPTPRWPKRNPAPARPGTGRRTRRRTTDVDTDDRWRRARGRALARFAHGRKGFFTDTSICIGCKACEVACKEWNNNPQDGTFELLGSSYDNTGSLGANTWRHVAFIEQDSERIEKARESGRKLVNLGMPTIRPRTDENAGAQPLDGALGAAAEGRTSPPVCRRPPSWASTCWPPGTGADRPVERRYDASGHR